MITVDCPHKVLFSGSYTVLDGFPALTVAVGPRLKLELNPKVEENWPRDNPFANAIRTTINNYLQEKDIQKARGHHPWGEFHTSLEQILTGWGLGTSAAFTTSLTYALCLSKGLKLTQEELFKLARSAHRLAQGGKGSGADIAACVFGGLVYTSGAQGDKTPFTACVDWPEDLGLLLIISGQKADTRKMILKYQQTPHFIARLEKRALLRSIGQVCRSFLKQEDILDALAENAQRESAWSQATQIPFVTPYQKQLENSLAPLVRKGRIVLKALGAGGGDSIGCFYMKSNIGPSEITRSLHNHSIQMRPAIIEKNGVQTASPLIRWTPEI